MRKRDKNSIARKEKGLDRTDVCRVVLGLQKLGQEFSDLTKINRLIEETRTKDVWLSFVSYLKSDGHNILLTSFSGSVREKYRFYGVGSTNVTGAARSLLPGPPLYSPRTR